MRQNEAGARVARRRVEHVLVAGHLGPAAAVHEDREAVRLRELERRPERLVCHAAPSERWVDLETGDLLGVRAEPAEVILPCPVAHGRPYPREEPERARPGSFPHHAPKIREKPIVLEPIRGHQGRAPDPGGCELGQGPREIAPAAEEVGVVPRPDVNVRVDDQACLARGRVQLPPFSARSARGGS